MISPDRFIPKMKVSEGKFFFFFFFLTMHRNTFDHGHRANYRMYPNKAPGIQTIRLRTTNKLKHNSKQTKTNSIQNMQQA